MRLPEFSYVAPRSLAEACTTLEEMDGKAAVIAGGTDLLQPLKEKLKRPHYLVDLRSIPGLDEISYDPKEGLTLGAMVSLRHLAASRVVKQTYPVLAQAALEVATAQIQAMGTVGGNLCQDSLCLYYNRSAASKKGLELCLKAGGDVCHTVKGSGKCWATFCSDLAPVFLVLGARIKIVDKDGERVSPLAELYSGHGRRPLTLKPGQVLTQIMVPPVTGSDGAVYLKLRLRQSIDYPALGVAAGIRVKEETQKIAVALTGVEKKPLLFEKELARDQTIGEDVIRVLAEQAYAQAHPLNNLRDFTPKYRKEMVPIYVRSALQQALHWGGQ
ncbi:FAD binding domain-containing protein [Paradesulfitobacterium ferrireducens]|uniref:FAD binding domain-containing protein n=1 Tax=Paradesulfitobacterium ferrireducens TaxID=2816476 RepID=UPI001A8F4191|nr:FAD binding domain-containing protein [Paradesulfitobacterium ferrireducens]